MCYRKYGIVFYGFNKEVMELGAFKQPLKNQKRKQKRPYSGKSILLLCRDSIQKVTVDGAEENVSKYDLKSTSAQ